MAIFVLKRDVKLQLTNLQGIKFKVIGPPSQQDVIDACAKDALKYSFHMFLLLSCFLWMVFVNAFCALTLLVGRQEGIQPVNAEWWGTRMVNCLEQGANDLHMVHMMPPHHFLLQ